MKEYNNIGQWHETVLDLLENQRFEDAETVCEQLCSMEPEQADYYYLRSLVYKKQNNQASAVAALQTVVKLAPDVSHYWKELGSTLLDVGQFKDAVDALAKAHALDSSDVRILVLWAHALQEMGKEETALELLEAGVNNYPQSCELWMELATLLYEAGQEKKCLHALGQVTAINAPSGDVWFRQGAILLAMEKYEQARVALKKAVALQPDMPMYWHCLGEAEFFLEQYDQSLAAIEKSVALHSDDPSTFFRLGYLYTMYGDIPAAIKAYEQSVQYQIAVAALDNLSTLYREQGLHHKIGEIFDWALEVEGHNIEILRAKGVAHYLAEQYEEAILTFTKYIGFVPDDFGVHTMLGNSLHTLGRGDEAEKSCAVFLEANPNDARMWRCKGNVLRFADRPREAIEALQRSVQLDGTDCSSLEMLADVLEDQGHLIEAADMYKQLILLGGEEDGFLETGVNFFARQGQYAQAFFFLQDAIENNPMRAFAWWKMGMFRLDLLEYEDALECFDTLLEFEPESPQGLRGKGEALQGLQRDVEALECFNAAFSSAPDPVDMLWDMLDSYVAVGKLDVLLQTSADLLQNEPENDSLLALHGTALLFGNRTKESLQYFAQAVAMHSTFIWTYFYYGRALVGLERYAEAIALYDACKERDMFHVLLEIEKATAYSCMQKDALAEEIYEHYLQQEESRDQVWRGYVEHLMRAGKMQEAWRACHQWQKHLPEDPFPKMFKGRILLLQRKYIQAKACYEAALAQNSGISDAWRDYGFVLAKLRLLHAATSAYEQAVSLVPNDSGYISCQALHASLCGDHAYAVARYKEAVNLVEANGTFGDGISAVYWGEYSRVLLQAGDYVAAREAALKGLSLDSESEDAYDTLMQLEKGGLLNDGSR